MKVRVNQLYYHYPHGLALEDISLDVSCGLFVGIVGPNGSGKSTLLKNIYRALKPQKGTIYLDQQSLLEMDYKTSSQKMAVVTQENDIDVDFTVKEIVMMGRTPHKGLFEMDHLDDERLAIEALKQVGLQDYANQHFNELSGGEKQRVRLARALCQQPQVLILDEPTNHLDIYYQLQLFEIIKKLDITVISVIHDLNFASMYCDKIYVMNEGKIYGYGTPLEMMTPQLIEDVFHVKSEVTMHPLTHQLHITFLPNDL